MAIKIAIAGIGNCASALLQGIGFYQQEGKTIPPGLMHSEIGGYRISDIELVAAFDIDKRKVAKPVSAAIFAKPNCVKQYADVNFKGSSTIVEMAPIFDGLAAHMANHEEDISFRASSEEPVDIHQRLVDSEAEILISYLPVGSELATKHYAEACINAGVAMINCAPCFLASTKYWAEKFKKHNVPIVGDDIKSQLGATIVHRMLANLFDIRGIELKHTYQLNTGGNTDFLNMLDRSRLESKKISKTQAVTSLVDKPVNSDNVHIGPSDYVKWQKDNKIAFIRMEGLGFCEEPIELEMRLSVQDSPNSAGIVVDAIRSAKLALDRGIGGPVHPACSWLMKSPPVQINDNVAEQNFTNFVKTATS